VTDYGRRAAPEQTIPAPRPGRSPLAFVALIGPPAVGKSTVSAALVAALGVQVFRLREFARTCQSSEGFDAALFDTTDPLGWFGDATVETLLRAAFVDRTVPSQGLVLVENLPGSANQLQILARIAGMREAPLAVVELAADDLTLAVRATYRRVCRSCEPDLLGDPHQPASASTMSADHCERCSGPLTSRRSDDPAIFLARLERYRHRITAIRQETWVAGLPYQRVDATTDPPTSSQAVQAAIRSFDVLAAAVQPTSL
jgi:adenylate kinase family enzyme